MALRARSNCATGRISRAASHNTGNNAAHITSDQASRPLSQRRAANTPPAAAAAATAISQNASFPLRLSSGRPGMAG